MVLRPGPAVTTGPPCVTGCPISLCEVTPGPRSGRFSGIEVGGAAPGDGRSVARHGGPQRFVVKPRAATQENARENVRDT